MLGRYRIYLLLGVASLLAWLNLRAPANTEVVQATERSASVASLSAPDPAQLTYASQTAALPAQLNRPALDPANRDPFVVWTPPPPVVIAKPAPVVPVVVAPPPPPQPPPHNLTFAGRMTAPDGSQLVYVNSGNTSLTLVAGQTLPNGYRVESITAQAVELSYPPMNTTARLDLPAPPKYEIR